MIDDSNVVLISYPPGGFGNFIFHALTEFSNNTVKIHNDFKFSDNGNSHMTKKYTNVYYMDPDNYEFNNIDSQNISLILCDNGIFNDSYTKLRLYFPKAPIIRLVIDESVRPVIYQTCITKAKNSDVVSETLPHVSTFWEDCNNDYAIRENFTLLYHLWNHGWTSVDDPSIINVSIESLIIDPIDTLKTLILKIGGQVINHEKMVELCNTWAVKNHQYTKVYYDWIKIKKALVIHEDVLIDDITNLHDQGYINYCIERMFNVTIPVYDYRDWFKTTKDIKLMLQCLK